MWHGLRHGPRNMAPSPELMARSSRPEGDTDIPPVSDAAAQLRLLWGLC